MVKKSRATVPLSLFFVGWPCLWVSSVVVVGGGGVDGTPEEIQGQTGVKTLATSTWESSVVDPDWLFSDPDLTFQLVSDFYPDPEPASDPTWSFSNILKINFTFVFPSWKCVRLHIMTRYKLLREFFFYKNQLIFLNWAFLLRNCQVLSVFQKVYFKFISDPELPGSGSEDVTDMKREIIVRLYRRKEG